MKNILKIALISALSSTAHSALAENSTNSEIELNARTVQQIIRRPDQYTEQLIGELFKMNETGNVTSEDYELYQNVNHSKSRLRFVQQYLYLDLNGDGNITAEEKSKVSRSENKKNKAKFEVLFLQGDLDKNGGISYSELIKFSDKKIGSNRRYNRNDVNPMYFDKNKDGVVGPAEVSDGIAELVSNPPDDVNVRAPRTNAIGKCKLPKVTNNAELVVLSGYEGTRVSTVSVAGLDTPTSSATLHIEEGEKPLYIFTKTYDPMVWRVTGATERVQKLVLQVGSGSKIRGAGAVGLPKDRVAFTKNCIDHFNDAKSSKARIAAAKIAVSARAKVDKIIGSYNLGIVNVPSGKMTVSSRRDKSKIKNLLNETFTLKDGKEISFLQNENKGLIRSLFRFYNDGIQQVDVKNVVTNVKAEAYDVLPQQAGLAQLVSEGKVERTSDGYFHVKSDIARYPAGLAGAHSVKFLLGKGVKIPKGNPGHSSVYSEETGECISKLRRCR